MTKFRLWCVVFAALLVASCSSPESLATARSEISHFRELAAMRRFHQIYSEASDDLRNIATEKQVVDMLSAIDRKLGAVKDAQDYGWQLNFRTSGTVVTLSLKTTFERGTAIETFVYRVVGKEASLITYRITSNDLLTN